AGTDPINGSDQFIVLDTVPDFLTDLNSGGGDDTISVTRTTGDLSITASGSSAITVGNATTSLDAIQGAIRIFQVGFNSVTLGLTAFAAPTRQTLNVEGTALGHTSHRAGAAPTAASFPPIANFNFRGGAGGTTVFVYATPAGTTSNFVGQPGAWDTFAI